MRRYLGEKGFTLLELIIVIIILGVLAILGFTQYGRMVERARGAEARAILGDLRKLTYAFYIENGNVNNIVEANLNIGAPGAPDSVPNACPGQFSHYFSYAFQVVNANQIILTASRCTVNTGKNPGLPPSAIGQQTVTLTSTLNTGVDVWGGTGSY